ncbi:flavin adenine dinucleotide transporter FLX1 KNAG_0E01720 [Huiozyma naganishii CBS 8797]|uniref:Mitochondrial thiamine pyrophosphate carrier 1 n=1 Tax=Huiozyma naganishii (strain ATCC MYA-139 / BCRC 22969 / CBS 8797 / KCTC 17520 / NBRC 10181 / NCYC 3082 / Yp74L-3) TaxID=1071383 RepID=J7S6K0_HUIN7|nr:hypothetical protein KNAG_0E01720 [Kazachstania naganishii CBS 8797]CCK70434.1 hypothetical protein KNAG_0E01720 [Kazachstania naganishii CBS 8797]
MVELSPTGKEVVAGLSAGAVTSLAVHPLDLVKLRVQLRATKGARAGEYWAVLRGILGGEGALKFRQLYRGLPINLLGNSVAWALYFGIYGSLRDVVAPMVKSPSWAYLMAGGISGVATSVLTNPIWVVKTRIMAVDRVPGAPASDRSMGPAFLRLLREEGVPGLYRGMLPAVLGVGHGAVYFLFYDTLRERILRDRESKKLRNSETVLMTAVSKMVAVTAVYPLQLFKANQQSRAAVEGDYSLRSLVRKVVGNRGVRGLYTGLLANLVKAVPSTCITFCVYENLKYSL